MAKQKKEAKQKAIEETLWDSANKLRGSVTLWILNKNKKTQTRKIGDENIDFDEKMKSLQGEFSELLKAEAASKNDLLPVFKELGYEIKL